MATINNWPGYNTYIGARYVPLIVGEWNITKQYEPLSVVTHNGDSYTSNTFVPVGIDITNSTYWIATGQYNSQLASLQMEIDENTNSIIENTNNIENLTKRYVLLTDSLGEWPQTGDKVPDIILKKCNLTLNDNFFYYTTAGVGLGNPSTGLSFYSVIQQFESINPNLDKTTITNIILLTGGGDSRRSSAENIYNGASLLSDYVKNNYPNATIHLFSCYLTTNDTESSRFFTYIVPTYVSVAEKEPNLFHVTNSQYIYHDYSSLASDGQHPLRDNVDRLGTAISSYINNGSFNLGSDLYSEQSITPLNTITGVLRFYIMYKGDYCLVALPSAFIFTPSSPVSLINAINIASFVPSSYIYGVSSNNCNISLPATGTLPDGTLVSFNVVLYIYKGSISLYSRYPAQFSKVTVYGDNVWHTIATAYC